MIEIRVFTLGIAATNAYLIADTATGDAVVIDPVDDAALLHTTAQEAGWTIRAILATHAHFDHVLASQSLKDLSGAPFFIHAEAAELLKTLPQQGLMFTGSLFPETAEPDRLLTSTRELLEIGSLRLETLYTPGHAPGHLAFYMRDQQLVFSGDALFAGSIGRTDLPGGNLDLLLSSIHEQLLSLGDAVRVLPGHGPATTIGQERLTNPFLVK
ncbi:MAG: MBL fold metallo-hydrolase [Aggregatilineales bacterium]